MTNGESAKLTALDPDVTAGLNTDLAAVEQIIRDAVKCDVPLLHEASRHLMDAGGKRHRPLLTLLAARFGNASDPDVLRAAAAVELVHIAALCHDDVLDKAALRRGVPSVNARWGEPVAILTGDFLFSQAFLLLAVVPSQAARLEVNTFAELVTGQFREMAGPAPEEDPLDYYVTMATEKTASLMRSCVRLGALTSGADETAVRALERFGEALGVAFQITDDLLDLSESAQKSGKRPGADLNKNAPALPLLYAVRDTGPASDRLRELLESVPEGNGLDDDAREEALGLLRSHPALDRTREQLETYVQRAKDALAPLPEGPARDGLAAMCVAVAHRAG
ncbi:polyprenyl synthetase family protein [Streptomyces sp. AJS327]|uniref:polyprenyl synthetase family protein n=1 Tax=Streptomyces sp. AJS327 TaxID=2545265 RepID=UPI0027E4E4B3|nr:polyprenyl synthetase family protein [Streptomyces sp. AJS327]